jgi:glycine cleavage system H protein
MKKSLFNFSYRKFCVRFTRSHEWLKRLEGNKVQLGISEFAKKELGEIIYVDVDLKDEGENISKEEEIVALESVKAAASVYSPITGTIIKKNDNILELINKDCENEGWIYELEMTNPEDFTELLSIEEYKNTLL